VRLKDGAIDLYGTHRLSQMMLEGVEWERLDLYLESVNESKGTPTKRRTDIGPPLLQWTVEQLAEPGFLSTAYSVMKPYLGTEERNIEYRPIGYLENMTWRTNEPPDCEGRSNDGWIAQRGAHTACDAVHGSPSQRSVPEVIQQERSRWPGTLLTLGHPYARGWIRSGPSRRS
jgi:hypothetical protein